jgi:hypothetical protein
MKTNKTSNKILLIGFIVLSFLASICAAYSYANYGYSTSAYYAAIFDERGLASVVLRLDYTNSQSSNVGHLDLNIPGTEVKVGNVFVETTCTRGNKTASSNSYSTTAYSYSNYYDPVCPSGTKFVTATVEKLNSGNYRIHLNKTLAQGETARVLVFYRAFGYVEDTLLGKKFDFETIKYDFDVDNTRVSIDVDENLHLKEGDSAGQYRSSKNIILNGVASSVSDASVQSALSSSYRYVSYASGYVRQKSVLLSGETFRVSGTYSETELQLYLLEIVGVLTILGSVVWFISKKLKEESKTKNSSPPASKAEGKDYATSKNIEKKASLAETAVFSFMIAAGFALAVSFIVFILILGASRIQGAPLAIIGLIAWIGTAAWVYVQKTREGYGVASALMFVGFSVIVTPFMVLMATFLASSMKQPSYLHYY